ncbi:MAG: DUF262 domain-containing protein, partial [Bacteroidales bacterium]|nr:DUF262 domain-containing protein [Bacteroidales bacterium]
MFGAEMDLKGAKIRNFYKLGSDIAGDEETPRTFRIPYFQRPFKWTKNEIDILITDHFNNRERARKESKNDNQYFAGAIVTALGEDENIHSLIDGQQRYTTLFLANYLNFLLYRVYFASAIDRRDYEAVRLFESFKKCCDYLFLDSSLISLALLRKLHKNVMEDVNIPTVDPSFKYKVAFFLPKIAIDHSDYDFQYFSTAKDMFNRDIRLSYDRRAYNSKLKTVLAKSIIKLSSETGPDLTFYKIDESDPATLLFQEAIEVIFDRFKSFSTSQEDNTTPPQMAVGMIEAINNFISDLRFCVVQTGRMEDAFTLFEVLNDRALELEDLEIVKNYFFKTYVLFQEKSDETDDIDEFLNKMDEFWGEDIFSSGKFINSRISILGTIYITGSTTLTDDKKGQLRDKIKIYLDSDEIYTKESLEADFYIYYLTKKILEASKIGRNKRYELVISTICDPSTSYIKRFIVLANSLNMKGILPGVFNPLLKVYSGSTQANLDE